MVNEVHQHKWNLLPVFMPGVGLDKFDELTKGDNLSDYGSMSVADTEIP